jgi:uncharacterized protein
MNGSSVPVTTNSETKCTQQQQQQQQRKRPRCLSPSPNDDDHHDTVKAIKWLVYRCNSEHISPRQISVLLLQQPSINATTPTRTSIAIKHRTRNKGTPKYHRYDTRTKLPSLSLVLLLLFLLMISGYGLLPTKNMRLIEAYCHFPKHTQQPHPQQCHRIHSSVLFDSDDINNTAGVQSTRSLQSVVTILQQRTFITSSTILYAWHKRSTMEDCDPHVCTFHHHSQFMTSTSTFHQRQCSHLSNRWTKRSTALYMGKGDGKKKRTKKSNIGNGGGENSNAGTNGASSSSVSPASSSQPMRVSSNINVPVRQQIAIAQMNKMIRQQQQQHSVSLSSSSGGSTSSTANSQSFIPVSKPRLRTAYRRTWEEEEIVQKAEERKRRGQEPNWDVILNRTAVSPLLIVDGYNIIHAWPRLKKHMTKGDPSRARQLLVDDLENLQSIKGWRIECVFDGTRRSTIGPLGSGPGSTSSSSNGANGLVNPVTRGIDQATKQSVSKYGVRVVYSGVGMEADTYIEGRCLRAKNVTNGAITGSLIVATDDAMIRLSGQNAGAVCMSASRFVDELKAVQKAVAYRVEAAVAKVNGHAIRPEQLRGSANQVTMPTRFGRRSVLIEDKRNRTKTNKKEEMIDEEYELYLSSVIQQQVEEDENGIPWWAKVPEQANANLYKRL